MSLLPYSPIGGGVLSGKYNGGARPPGARFTRYLTADGPRQRAMAERFVNDRSLKSTGAFLKIATELEIHPVTLAVAWSKQHDFVASTIVGVSTEDQLDPIFAAAGLKLDDGIRSRIDEISKEIPYPM